MSELEALYAAILRDPLDDTVRLAYADKLDEIGGKENARRARFIRLQIEIANRPFGGNCGNHWCRQKDPCDKHKIWTPQDDVERDLWGTYPDADDIRSRVQETLPEYWWALPQGFHQTMPGPPYAAVQRGFVSGVYASEAFFDGSDHCGPDGDGGMAEWMFLRHPITTVLLANKTPYPGSITGEEDDRVWLWERNMSDVPTDIGWHYLNPAPNSHIPGAIFDLLAGGEKGGLYFVIGKYSDRRYADRDEALWDLSHACVAYGRTLAGLPPISRE